MDREWKKYRTQARVNAEIEETMDTLARMDSQYTKEEREMSKMIHFPDLYGNNGDKPNA